MGRPTNMVEPTVPPATHISSVQYGPANEKLSVSGVQQETYEYNSRLQLTRLATSGVMDMECSYSTTGQNNGQISKSNDRITGEEVSYAYDSLNRLISAVTTGPEWGLSFSYDGFGNKTAQTVTKGSGPVMNVAYNANNRVISPAFSYDADGNVTAIPNQGTLTYDIENRLSSLSFSGGVGTVQYLYGRNNDRVWARATGSAHDYEMVYFYGVDGKLLNKYEVSNVGSPGTAYEFNLVHTHRYFAGREVVAWTTFPAQDRLGSQGKFFPYGEAREAVVSGRDRFATYDLDGTGLDYARNRYYYPAIGRFLTPDPADAGQTAQPQSLNLYSYVFNDAINLIDESGLGVDIPLQDGGSPTSCLNFTLIPWLNNHGFTLKGNFGDFGNTATGVLAISLFYEDTHGSAELYQQFAQVLSNRYNLGKSDPTLAKKLGIPTGEFIYTFTHSSQVWSAGGDLLTSDDLTKVLDYEVVGRSNAIGAAVCDQLVSAMQVAYDATQKVVYNAPAHFPGTFPDTYWFFTAGADPVDHTAWNTSLYSVGAWTFERYISANGSVNQPKLPGPIPHKRGPHGPHVPKRPVRP
jgi:RHS repeat-associated protein